MEFGWINLFGACIVVLILIPNVVYALKTKNDTRPENHLPAFLSLCEQIGRYACIVLMWLPLLVGKFGFGSVFGLMAYVLLNGILIIAYFILWAVYAKRASLAAGLALAAIPTAIFLLSGLLLRHRLLTAAAVLFGAAHITITYLTHRRKDPPA